MPKMYYVKSYRRTRNLIDADVNVTGENAYAEDRNVTCALDNEQYIDGFKLTLVPADGGSDVVRFISDGDINELVFGTSNPSSPLTVDQLETFCQLLTQRENPIRIETFDSTVPLDEVRAMSGITGDSLIDDENPGISSISQGERGSYE